MGDAQSNISANGSALHEWKLPLRMKGDSTHSRALRAIGILLFSELPIMECRSVNGNCYSSHYSMSLHRQPEKLRRLTLNSSRNSFPSSAALIRISSSRCSTGIGKYFFGPEGDLLRSITLCCSVKIECQTHCMNIESTGQIVYFLFLEWLNFFKF